MSFTVQQSTAGKEKIYRPFVRRGENTHCFAVPAHPSPGIPLHCPPTLTIQSSLLRSHLWTGWPVFRCFLRHKWANSYFFGTQWSSSPYILSKFIEQQGFPLQFKLPLKQTERSWGCLCPSRAIPVYQNIQSKKCIIICIIAVRRKALTFYAAAERETTSRGKALN